MSATYATDLSLVSRVDVMKSSLNHKNVNTARKVLGAGMLTALAYALSPAVVFAEALPGVDRSSASATGVVSGQIADALGRPLSDVAVQLKTADGKVAASAKTGADGQYRFNQVAPGSYEVSADKYTFIHGSRRVAVSATQAAQASLTLASTEALAVKAARLDRARNGISVETGSSIYRLSNQDIKNLPQGESSSFNQVMLQMPGVAQDSYGQLHVRGDHANLQYRLNGILLPESIAGFGQTLDAHFIQSASLLTGALPAQYGYRTAGVVDIQTRSGALADGGSIGIMVGSQGTRELSGSVSGSKGDLNYFMNGSVSGSDIGIENPTNSYNAVHDKTRQLKGFGYFSYLIDDTSRASLILGSTNSRFEIPNAYGQTPNYTLAGVPNIPSQDLNERQRESTRYGILSYQSKIGSNFDYQVSAFTRFTDVFFTPDVPGDLMYEGVASTIARSATASGVQADASYKLTDTHTLRMGTFASVERLRNSSDIQTFTVDAFGNQTSTTPVAYGDQSAKNTTLTGVYLQDEWKAAQKLTINYGVRFDRVNAYNAGEQWSPRLGAVYQLTPATTLHAGYARYFTPPTSELVGSDTIAASQGTASSPPTSQNSPVRSESTDYYDIGVNHRLSPSLTIGVDSYYKHVKHLLDEGQFGTALLYTPFNYAEGKIYGVEFTSNYRKDNLSAYVNVAASTALGKQIESSQYNFEQAELDYISRNWVHLDHDQHITGSAGAAYVWRNTTYAADAIYGSGLRSGFANTDSLPVYTQVNLSATHPFVVSKLGKVEGRISVLNVFDKVYEIRDGSGIGVGAPQFGPRRGIYLGLTKTF